MDWEKLELSPKIINALKKGTRIFQVHKQDEISNTVGFTWLTYIYLIWIFSANVNSLEKILSLPAPDLQRLLHLSSSEVQLVHTTVAALYRSVPPVTGKHTVGFHRHARLNDQILSFLHLLGKQNPLFIRTPFYRGLFEQTLFTNFYNNHTVSF